MSPSIYQFITTSRTPQGNDKGWPGLGGSELHYAWTIMAYAIGETVIAPVAGFTTERFPYVFSLLATLVFFSIGGIFYANSTQVWMVIVARFIIGLGAGYGAVVVHSYLGEMSTRFDEIRQKKKKKPIKHIFYICFLFLMNGAFVFSFGTTSIVAQFDRVNPYQWPGYFLAALAVLYGFVMIIFFRDIRSLPKLKEIKLNCRCLTGLKLTKQLQSNWKMQFVVYGYLACCGLAGGHLYAINSTIIPPILSDQFGFNVKYTSYYFIGVAIALLASTFILLPAKVFRIDNRKILGVVYVLCFIGAILMGDWQAVNQDDPCLAGSGFDNDTSRQCSESEIFFSGTGESNSELSHHELVKNCTSLSSPSHQCFLNPDSDITGEFCNTCLCACLSKQTTINFYQFTVGILLISFATPLAFVLISAIASDIAPVTSQVSF
jgi:MFS family permease